MTLGGSVKAQEMRSQHDDDQQPQNVFQHHPAQAKSDGAEPRRCEGEGWKAWSQPPAPAGAPQPPQKPPKFGSKLGSKLGSKFVSKPPFGGRAPSKSPAPGGLKLLKAPLFQLRSTQNTCGSLKLVSKKYLQHLSSTSAGHFQKNKRGNQKNQKKMLYI